MRFLATSDVHIGRRPAAVSDIDAEEFSCANAWLRVVDLALAEKVDAVLLGGDVVDQENRFFEALAPLEQGLKRLGDAQIPVCAVGGNHDWDVLAQLASADASGNIHLLGRGGRWEHVLLPGSEAPQVQLFGWSFPNRSVRDNPLAQFPRQDIRSDLTALGLLHADRGASGSRYAPVSASDLEAARDVCWILGHVHLPDDLDATVHAFYPGSPQGLDMGRGERGAHGPVLVEVDQGRVSLSRPVSFLAPLRYERPEFNLGLIRDDAEVYHTFLEAVRGFVASVRAGHPDLRVLCLRPLCRCTSILRASDIRERLAPLWRDGEPIMVDSVSVQIDDVLVEVRPEVDLAKLGEDRGVLGQLARLLLDLQEDTTNDATVSLLADIAKRRRTVWGAPAFAGLPQDDSDSPPPSDRDVLSEQAWRLLHELLLQRGDDAGV